MKNCFSKLPNYLTISRIIFSIFLLLPKSFSLIFYLIYIYCGISDILDGIIARINNNETILGEKLDSIADFIFIIVSMYKILPFISLNNISIILIIIIMIIKLFNASFLYIVNKKLISLHTIPNKITGLLLFIYPLLLKIKLNIYILILIALYSAINEMITINKIRKDKIK